MNIRLALLLFLAPVFFALFYTLYSRESQQEQIQQMAREGVLAIFEGGQVTQDDLKHYFESPPIDESPILRGLEMTAEDVVGLETEDPDWFTEPPGQLLLSRVIKHIALIEIFNHNQPPEVRSQLQDDVTAFRESLMIQKMEDELDDIKPNVTQEEMMAYYLDNSEQFHQEGRRFVRHIMLVASDEPTEAASDPTQSIPPEWIQEQLRSGTDFHSLVPYSQSESINQDGYLGWLEKGTLAEAFEDVVWSMEVGEIKGPVPVNGSLHFIHLMDAQEEGLKPFRACIPEIRETLQKKKRNVHRLKLLGLPTEPETPIEPNLRQDYRQALLDVAYARGWNEDPAIVERVDHYQKYHKADLSFQHFVEELKESGRLGNTHSSSVFVESETIKRLLSQYDFRIIIKLDQLNERSKHEFQSHKS